MGPSAFRTRVLWLVAVGALGLSAPAPARAQIYTWTGSTSTNFNDSTNWRSAFTFPIPANGTLWLVPGSSGSVNRPTLTASATAGWLNFGSVGSAGNGSFAFNSSDPAAVLSLTGTRAISAYMSSGTGAISTNIQFLGTGTQSILGISNQRLVLSGTLSGGDANGRLAFGQGNFPIPNAANTFVSPLLLQAEDGSGGLAVPQLVVSSFGMAGSPSSLGTSGTVQMLGSGYIRLTSTAVAQTTDKAFELGMPSASHTGTSRLGDYRINYAETSSPFGSPPILNLTGPIRTLPITGTSVLAGPSVVRFWSGTVSGLISEAAGHPLAVQTRAALLTNPNNSFSGGFTLGPGVSNVLAGLFSISSIGMLGTPSVIGTGSITVDKTGTFRYVGPGETTNRPLRLGGDALAPPVLEASGSGPLVLTAGTVSIFRPGSYDPLVFLGGTGSGRITSNIVGVSGAVIRKVGAGTWTLTGTTNSFPVSGNQGTLIFGARAALQGGTAANWTKPNIFTFCLLSRICG